MSQSKQLRSLYPVIFLGMTAAIAFVPRIALSHHDTSYFTVDSTLDEPDAAIGDCKCASTPSSKCTLRAAVQEGQAVNQAVSVPAGLYELKLGHLEVTQNLTLTGAGSGKTLLDGSYKSRVFDISNTGFAYIGGVTVQWGKATPGFANHSHGGGIHNHGSLTLVDSTVRASSTDNAWGGGGIASAPGSNATLVNVTITGNSASGYGGGIENGGSMDVYNSTIVGNQSFASETSGGGIADKSNNTRLINSIVASNFYGKNCYGTVTEQGYNLSSDETCKFSVGTNNIDPMLSLRDDRDMYPLQSGSPAIDAGANDRCSSTDQRGTTRPQDGNGNGIATCDIGAHEFVTNP